MPHHINWYIPGRVLYIYLYDNIELSEYIELVKESNAMIRSGGERVHAITNLLDTRIVPNNISALRAASERPDNAGFSIIVNRRLMSNFILGIIGRVVEADVKLARSLEEALQVLRDNDASLYDIVQPDDDPGETKQVPTGGT